MFEIFWESECPRIGEESSLTWDVWHKRADAGDIQCDISDSSRSTRRKRFPQVRMGRIVHSLKNFVLFTLQNSNSNSSQFANSTVSTVFFVLVGEGLDAPRCPPPRRTISSCYDSISYHVCGLAARSKCVNGDNTEQLSTVISPCLPSPRELFFIIFRCH